MWISSPASVMMAISLSFFPKSMPIWSTARLPFLCTSSARYGLWGHDATTPGGEPLHLIYRLQVERHPVTVIPTFLGAHEVPLEHRADRGRYVGLLV